MKRKKRDEKPLATCKYIKIGFYLFKHLNAYNNEMKIPYIKRIVIGVITGAILGIICIVGVGSRLGFDNNEIYLIGMWYNRVVMGAIVGLSGEIMLIEDNNNYNAILRGTIFGTIITSAIFFSTSFRDVPSFFAGI